MKKRYFNMNSYEPGPGGCEVVHGATKTVPNDCDSLQDLFERYLEGTYPGLQSFDDELDEDDWNLPPEFGPGYDMADADMEARYLEDLADERGKRPEVLADEDPVEDPVKDPAE